MKPGFRDYLFLAAIAAGALLLFLWWTGSQLRPELENRMRSELERTARLSAKASSGAAFSDSLADQLGTVSGERITLIDRDGVVLGDSKVDAARLPRIENHADRPEIAAALGGRIGFNVRASETVSLPLMYVAIPDPRGAVRVASPISAVDAVIVRTRQFAVTGTLSLLLFAAGLFLLRRWQIGRSYSRVVTALRGIERGRFEPQFDSAGNRKPGGLESEVDRLAVSVGQQMGRLRYERDDLEAVFLRLHDGLAVVNREGVISRANTAFAQWMGRDQVIGERIGALFRDPETLKTINLALGGSSAQREATIGERTAYMEVQPHRDGLLVVLRDLTRRRRLESVRRDFVANVSHELKTPLTSVRGFAEAMATDDLETEQVRQFGARIVANTRRMQLLVDDLLELTRIEAGNWSPDPTDADLAELAREVWASMQPFPDEHRIQLEISCSSQPTAHVDPTSLHQILQNLFDNAVRYSPDAGVIRLTSMSAGDGTRVEVSDEGPGIPSAHLDRVFERFYRVDAARSRERGGTGLGLSIVKHLVAAHHGKVGIESELGNGTKVWFVLPSA